MAERRDTKRDQRKRKRDRIKQKKSEAREQAKSDRDNKGTSLYTTGTYRLPEEEMDMDDWDLMWREAEQGDAGEKILGRVGMIIGKEGLNVRAFAVGDCIVDEGWLSFYWTKTAENDSLDYE